MRWIYVIMSIIIILVITQTIDKIRENKKGNIKIINGGILK